MSFWRLYYHLVWGTKNRHPTLQGEVAATAERSIRADSRDLGLIFYAVGMMPEHVHLLVGIPPKHAVSDVVKQLKGSSSHLINTTKSDQAWFGWQNEYGIVSFGERSLDQMIGCVSHQRKHHLTGDLIAYLERLDRERPESVAGLSG